MAGPDKLPDTNLKPLRDVAKSPKYMLKTFGEYTGFTSPFILEKISLSKQTTNDLFDIIIGLVLLNHNKLVHETICAW